MLYSFGLKCTGGLASRIGGECVLLARIFSIIVFSSRSFLWLCSSSPLLPFVPRTVPGSCRVLPPEHQGSAEGRARGARRSRGSAPPGRSASQSHGTLGAGRTVHGTCLGPRVPGTSGTLRECWENGLVCPSRDLEPGPVYSLRRPKFGCGDGSVVWKHLNCVIVAEHVIRNQTKPELRWLSKHRLLGNFVV